MKSYKVSIDLANKDNPYRGMLETKVVIVEADIEANVPRLALSKINIPSDKIYFQMCWIEV